LAKFKELMKEKTFILADGAMGTSLQEKGLSSGEIPEKWNLDFPEEIVNIHQQYLKAGSELLETNTFGASYLRLKEAGLEGQIEKINSKAVELARKAADENTLIAGSVGPCGKMIKPLGTISEKEVFTSYKKQIKLLVENSVDLIIVETITALNEMEQALKALESFEIPFICQMSFEENHKTIMGAGVRDVVTLMEKYQPDMIGVNCTPGAEKTLSLVKEFSAITELPISVFPNAGKPELKDGQVIYPEKAETLAYYLEDFLENNVKLIGGCCGSSPETIKAIFGKAKKLGIK